ncbi:hypothetical protein [Reichenbachiella sp.]|uniref:hypothetical protein n=1 Tax=Reichenbachiella sp. TaxID=2184521 RepID=UPI003B592B50
MSHKKIISAEIANKTTASIICTNSDTQLDQPLWAINWFDLKRGWLYELYNRLAFQHVKGVGAYPIFKGQLEKVLLSNERLQRDMLLVVRYPKAQSLLDMLSVKLFQLKSLLRNAAVRHFQFGFMKQGNQPKEEPPSLKYMGKLKFMVHVCENEDHRQIDQLVAYANSNEVFPYFIGSKSAIMGLQQGKGRIRTIDFILSHVLIFSAFDDETLEAFVNSAPYQQLIQKSESSFSGIYRRKI